MDLLYELWLHDVCRFNAKKVDKCLYIFENAYNAFHSTPYSMDKIRSIGLSTFFSANRNFDNANRILADCKEKGIRIITIEDKNYPELLRHIHFPPRILFVKGKFSDFNSYFPVSIVGTRKSTPQGNLFTKKLSEGLVKNNKIIVVSGMAEGIDSFAHVGALEGGGITVAVLAGGPDIIYPKSNRSLYYKILENGAVISEHPPGDIGKSYYYRERNRIIAGFSRGTIFVEGTCRKSGTNLTLNHALENSRDIFAVPSSPLSPQSQLPAKLLKEGAILLENENDFTEEYCQIYPEYFNTGLNNNKKDKNCSFENLSDDEKLIVNYILKCGGIANAENMAAELDIPVGKLNGVLTVLCIKDILCQQSQSQYLLKEA